MIDDDNENRPKYLDLSYPLDHNTIFWPNGEGFCLCMNSSKDSRGYFYSAGVITCSEHCGTHVDAPYHFSESGKTVDQIPLCNLISECRVVDISAECLGANGYNYSLVPEDILVHEEQHGKIQSGMIVLIKTGWWKYYERGSMEYLGFDNSTVYDPSTSVLRFPGIGESAAALFVDRQVSAVGLDTASLDPGYCKDFTTHRILLGAGIYGIENINSNIEAVPPIGATLFVMPMKITGGSGAPARICAVLPRI